MKADIAHHRNHFARTLCAKEEKKKGLVTGALGQSLPSQYQIKNYFNKQEFVETHFQNK